MKNISALVIILSLVCVNAAADEWSDQIGMAQKLSRSKMKTSSGKRILREKIHRINQIDMKVPGLIKQGNYTDATALLKESLRLTVEYYGSENNLQTAERFTMLGIVFMESGGFPRAEETFSLALGISKPLLGKDSYQLANIYKFLAVAYAAQDKNKKAAGAAKQYLGITIGKFGPKSPEGEEAKEFFKKYFQ